MCEFTWVKIDLDGCNRVNDHGEKQKQGKNKRNWVSSTYFSMHAHREKNQEVGSDGHGDERGLFGEIQGKEEACDAIYTYLRKEEAKQTNNGARNNENQQPQIYANQRK